VSVTDGLRERKKAETRAALAVAALRLADERGPDGFTVEDVAEAAQVSPRTFFNYFATKDDAIIGLADASSAELLDRLLARPASEPPLEAIHQAFRAHADTLEAYAEEWSIRQRLARRHPHLAARYAARFAMSEEDFVAEVARRCGLDPERDLYPATVVAAAMGAARVAIAAWQRGDRPQSVAELIDEAFALLGDLGSLP
jgi:AcrR family transcriptional regulator